MDSYHTLSNESIRALCTNPPLERLISGEKRGNRILKISNSLVVKYGFSVTEEEARNQRRASQLLNPDIVRVPQVQRFFRDDSGKGYLVMDFVEGKVVNTFTEPHYQKVAAILDHFRQFSGKNPGNIDGQGFSYYCPFPDEGLEVSSVDKMEEWFNSRLFTHQSSGRGIHFRDCNLVLCHRDLAPRNMIWQMDGSVFLLDWLTAGFYPISFEICTQRFGNDIAFNQKVEEIISSYTKVDERQLEMICRVWGNIQKYTFDRPHIPCPIPLADLHEYAQAFSDSPYRRVVALSD